METTIIQAKQQTPTQIIQWKIIHRLIITINKIHLSIKVIVVILIMQILTKQHNNSKLNNILLSIFTLE